MSFKNWLLTESSKSRLAIFDFDKTLALTPEKPEGWVPTPIPGKKTSNDWFTHPDSMSSPHYDGRFNEPIVREFLAAKSDPDTHAVMLTGRVGMRTAPMIRSHLHRRGLFGHRVIGPAHIKAKNRAETEDPQHPHQHHDDAHEEYYKGDFRQEPDYPKNEKGTPLDDTLNHKLYVVKRLMHDGVQILDFYDDREEHRESFLQGFEELMQIWPSLRVIRMHAILPDHILEHTLVRGNPEWQHRQVPLHGKVVLPEPE